MNAISRRRLIEDRDTFHELTSKIQELQNEINCMNDSRDFKDAESVRSGQSHVTSQLAFFPPFRDPGGMLSQPQRRAAKHLGHAWNSVIFSGGDSSKNYGADQQRLQISDPHIDKFSTSATFACWWILFKTEVCISSQFPTEAMLWIKEVELVDSVDDLKSSCSVRGIQISNFEVLDAKIASALNRILSTIPNSKERSV